MPSTTDNWDCGDDQPDAFCIACVKSALSEERFDTIETMAAPTKRIDKPLLVTEVLRLRALELTAEEARGVLAVLDHFYNCAVRDNARAAIVPPSAIAKLHALELGAAPLPAPAQS